MTLVLAFLHYQFAGLWPLLWHFGIGGLLIAACVALYLFTPAFLSRLFPRVQSALIWIASVTLAIMISTAIGVSLGEKRIQAQWDASLANAIEAGKQAHNDAVRDVARKPHRWVRNNRDRYDRDQH